MLLYTDVPIESVLAGINEPREDYLEMEWQGIKFLVEPVGDNEGKIVQMMSTDPRNYLNPCYMPGSIVCYTPHFEQM